MSTTDNKKVIIVGGGFAGVKAAFSIAKHSAATIEVTVVDRQD